MSHTPGPWEIDFRNTHTGQVAVCHGDGEGYFEVWSRLWRNGIDQEANARLISAAPDMLEALKNLVAAVEALRGLHIVVPELAQAKRAIAKGGA